MIEQITEDRLKSSLAYAETRLDSAMSSLKDFKNKLDQNPLQAFADSGTYFGSAADVYVLEQFIEALKHEGADGFRRMIDKAKTKVHQLTLWAELHVSVSNIQARNAEGRAWAELIEAFGPELEG